jgi:hypothetical protein
MRDALPPTPITCKGHAAWQSSNSCQLLALPAPGCQVAITVLHSLLQERSVGGSPFRLPHVLACSAYFVPVLLACAMKQLIVKQMVATYACPSVRRHSTIICRPSLHSCCVTLSQAPGAPCWCSCLTLTCGSALAANSAPLQRCLLAVWLHVD